MKIIYCLSMAFFYQVAFNPFVLAIMLLLFGQWQAAIVVISSWTLACALAVITRVSRQSKLPGLSGTTILTARPILNVLGDEEQGWAPKFLLDAHPKWPEWLVAFVCCWWRNKLRNIAFTMPWLHRPSGELRTEEWARYGVNFRLRTRGWMAEFEWWRGIRFGDFGPRLDQPDAWGGISWAFRPWGKD